MIEEPKLDIGSHKKPEKNEDEKEHKIDGIISEEIVDKKGDKRMYIHAGIPLNEEEVARYAYLAGCDSFKVYHPRGVDELLGSTFPEKMKDTLSAGKGYIVRSGHMPQHDRVINSVGLYYKKVDGILDLIRAEKDVTIKYINSSRDHVSVRKDDIYDILMSYPKEEILSPETVEGILSKVQKAN